VSHGVPGFGQRAGVGESVNNLSTAVTDLVCQTSNKQFAVFTYVAIISTSIEAHLADSNESNDARTLNFKLFITCPTNSITVHTLLFLEYIF
jgi:hypothetical protein